MLLQNPLIDKAHRCAIIDPNSHIAAKRLRELSQLEFSYPMDRAAIGDQIDRILHSRSFAGKSQLAKLLEVLFHHMDSQTALKPDRVIKELWPEETRTKRSADVATEMNRLRKTLECYYNGDGAADPIIINLPNRSVTAPDGLREKRWIVAGSRDRKS